MQKRHEIKEKSRYLKQIPGFLLVREAGLEFQESGIYGIFETFIYTKRPFCIKYSNIPN